jgi:hypothetical protein
VPASEQTPSGLLDEIIIPMPEISRFFGIIIAMYYDDHQPPHFHVRYGDDKAIVSIESLSLLEGRLSPRTLGLVTEWPRATKQNCEKTGIWPDNRHR